MLALGVMKGSAATSVVELPRVNVSVPYTDFKPQLAVLQNDSLVSCSSRLHTFDPFK